MKRAIRERLERTLDSSTSETDSSTPDQSFSCLLNTLQSPRITPLDTYKKDLHDRSSSASSFEAGSRSQEEESVFHREQSSGYLERLVSSILTDSSSLSEEEGGTLDGGETYIPQWLRQRNDSVSKDEEQGLYKDVKNATSSRLLSVSDELQTLSKKLKNGAGSDRSSSSNVSSNWKHDFRRKRCVTIQDCKKRLEYLISKLEGLDGEVRPLPDSSIDDGVVLGDTKNDNTVDAVAFGSLVRTEPMVDHMGLNKDTLSNENALEMVDPHREVTYQRSPRPEPILESVNIPQLPAVDIEGSPLEAKNGKSTEVKSRRKSRSRTRRRKPKKDANRRRTFKGMVETKVLPRVRVARAMAEIPKAKLTKPVILARKPISSDFERDTSNNKEEASRLPLTPNKTNEEIATSKEEPKDAALTSPDTVKYSNSKQDVILNEVENKGSRKEGNVPSEIATLEKELDPSPHRRHRERKPTSDGAGMHSTNRPVIRRTKTTSFRTPSMENSSTKSQGRSNESTKKKTQPKRTPSRNNSSARSKHKKKEPQCLDLLLSDTDLQDPEPRSGTPTSSGPPPAKTPKASPSHENKTSKEPDLSEEGAKKSPKRLSSLFRLALRRNDSLDTGDMFRKRNSIGKERTARLKESRLGETWRRTKNAFDSVWEKNFNQAHTAPGLLSFFRSSKATKSQHPWRFTA